jgi:hypothetical protein
MDAQPPPARPPPERPPPEMPGLYGSAAASPVGANVHSAPCPLCRHPCSVVSLTPNRNATRCRNVWPRKSEHADGTKGAASVADGTQDAAHGGGRADRQALQGDARVRMPALRRHGEAHHHPHSHLPGPQATPLLIAARWPLGCALVCACVSCLSFVKSVFLCPLPMNTGKKNEGCDQSLNP